LELCIRLNNIYGKGKLRLNISNGTACVKVELFRVCVAFEISDMPIIPNSPPCTSNKRGFLQYYKRALRP